MRQYNYLAGYKCIGILVLFLAPGIICNGQRGPTSGKQEVRNKHAYIYPLKLTPGYRFLTDQNNDSFFWSGDAAWSLIAQLSNQDVDLYLDNRK